MKKLFLSMAVVAMLFSCSKDTIETETTADLTQMTSNKSLEQSKEQMYYGVFGHNSNRELHGKISINKSSNGEYTARIDLVNGEVLTFLGNGLNNQKLHFTGDRGSFDFDISDTNAKASNIFIDQETEAYIETRRGVGIVILGAYEQTGNEANFYGNWDIFLTEIVSPTNNESNQRGGGGSNYIFDAVVVSHKGNRGPFIDASFEFIDNCEFSGQPPLLVDIPGDGSWFDIWCDDQVSSFAGHQSNWDILVVPGWHNDYVNYFSDDLGSGSSCSPAAAGTWSWAGRSGSITLLSHIPVPPPTTNDGNNRAINAPYNK